METSDHFKNGATPKSLMSRIKPKGEIMIFKKFYNLVIVISVVTLVMSCAMTKKTSTITKENTVAKTDIKEKLEVESKVDKNISNENINKIEEYLRSSDASRFMDIKKIFEPYNTVDEVINQESFSLLIEIFSFVPKEKYEHTQAKEHRNEAPEHFNGMIEKFENELKQEIKDYLELISFLITKGANVGYLNNEGSNTLTLFLKAYKDMGRRYFAEEKNRIYEQIIENATGVDIIFAAQNIFEIESFKKAVDKTPDINLIVETEQKQKRNALHYIILNLNDQKNFDVNLDKAIFLLERGIKVIEKDWSKQGEEHSMIVTVLQSAGLKYEKHETICKKMIEAGANVNLVANLQTPLFILLYRQFRQDIEPLLELLIEKGADVNYVFRDTQTPLDLMIPRLKIENDELRNKAIRITEILKSKGAKTFAELQE
jgi:ankyrin repeat protein